MELTRRQLIKGTLATMAASICIRPLPIAKPGDTFWWLNATDLVLTQTDQPEALVFGYWDDATQGWKHFEGAAAQAEIVRLGGNVTPDQLRIPTKVRVWRELRGVQS